MRLDNGLVADLVMKCVFWLGWCKKPRRRQGRTLVVYSLWGIHAADFGRYSAGPFANVEEVVSPMSRIVDIFSATVMQEGGTKEDRALAASGLSRLTPLYARIVSGGKTICHDEGRR